ncbi:MAG: transcription antitermination factor NusB [Deltaproteobacteria bacterium]|nr:transcription antitermination factor NusB [Deltaproteobacteria bacterium]
MPNRRKLREYAVQILYGLDFYDIDATKSVQLHAAHFAEESIEDRFLERLIAGVAGNRELIDGLIRQYSTNWRLERMAIVDRNILRMATYELLNMPEIPRKVSINEAIEIAKKFGGDDSPSFINGILDRIALEIRGPETEEERLQGEAHTGKKATPDGVADPTTGELAPPPEPPGVESNAPDKPEEAEPS